MSPPVRRGRRRGSGGSDPGGFGCEGLWGGCAPAGAGGARGGPGLLAVEGRRSVSSQQGGTRGPGRPCGPATVKKSQFSLRNIPPAAVIPPLFCEALARSVCGVGKSEINCPPRGYISAFGVTERLRGSPASEGSSALLRCFPACVCFGVSCLKLRIQSPSLTVYCFEFVADAFLLRGYRLLLCFEKK